MNIFMGESKSDSLVAVCREVVELVNKVPLGSSVVFFFDDTPVKVTRSPGQPLSAESVKADYDALKSKMWELSSLTPTLVTKEDDESDALFVERGITLARTLGRKVCVAFNRSKYLMVFPWSELEIAMYQLMWKS